MIGEIIDGRYRILDVLGEGGMGAVYEAEHTGTGRRVAVKVIHAHIARKSEIVARFQLEAKAAGGLETPHVVQVLDTGTDPVTGVIYMAMELLRGEDVQELLKRHDNLPTGLALRLVGQACIGLGKAHAAGFIHRDIKPANLFLSRLDSGAVVLKVVDFGIAKMMDPQDVDLTSTGGMLGSPLYMSPEQANGSKKIDQRTDVWSLGVTLYKALTGRAPHTGIEAGMQLLTAICRTPAPPIQDVAPWVPPAVAQIVHRMLAIVPDDRFPSTAAVLEAILPLVPGGLSVQASDLVGLGEAERAHRAPRAILAEDVVTSRRGPAPSNSSPSELASASTGDALSVSQGTTHGSSSARKTRLRLMIALPLVLGVGSFVVYALGSHPATPTARSEPVVAALVASVASAPPVVVAQAPPPDERTVRLAVEPADATAEVDGRATPVKDGGIELHGVIGSAHHVRLVKGTQETVAEVAITALGAVPPRMQVETIAPRLFGKLPGARVDSGRAAPSATAPASTSTGLAPAKKFE